MIRHFADWVLPISAPPIVDGYVDIDADRIVGVGPRAAAPAISASGPSAPIESLQSDRGSATARSRLAILPGLVNAHTHLELSYLRDRVPEASSFVEWIRGIIAARRSDTNPRGGAGAGAGGRKGFDKEINAEINAAIHAGIAEAVACGTALVGDISNTLATFEPLLASPLGGVVFYELIRFNATDAAGFVAESVREIARLPETDRLRAALAAHAPYSVAPEVFREIRRVVDAGPSACCSVHLAEGAEEVEFLQTGEGPWRRLLEEIGAWTPAWRAPGLSPVDYLDAEGFLGPRVLTVHGVQMSRANLERLAARGATLVTCPRSNRYTGAGDPPVEDFYASGVRVAIGTDSLASAPDLNLFAELAALRTLAPSIPARLLLESATRQGAHALGFAADYGTLGPGKRGRAIAISVPLDVTDVEEYLVSGIAPDRIRWLDAADATG